MDTHSRVACNVVIGDKVVVGGKLEAYSISLI